MIETKDWFFQYGRWDLRIKCPKCGKREAEIVSLEHVYEDDIIDDFKCVTCGFKGALKLVGDMDAAIANADRYEQGLIKWCGADCKTFNLRVVQKKKRKPKQNPFYFNSKMLKG